MKYDDEERNRSLNFEDNNNNTECLKNDDADDDDDDDGELDDPRIMGSSFLDD